MHSKLNECYFSGRHQLYPEDGIVPQTCPFIELPAEQSTDPRESTPIYLLREALKMDIKLGKCDENLLHNEQF
jgi:hypothetical protein